MCRRSPTASCWSAIRRRWRPTNWAYSLVAVAALSAAEPTVEVEALGLFHADELIVARDGSASRRVRVDEIHRSPFGFEYPAGVEIEIPGKLRRRYLGPVALQARGREIVVAVRLPLRTYLASAVAAEAPADAAPAALEAQAIVSRSYAVGAAPRHPQGRFCDTTHCQWIREAPPPRHPAWAAVDRTAGLVLVAEGRTLPGLFSRSCGGETRDGLEGPDARFRAVVCPVCRRLPTRWSRNLSAEAASELLASQSSERARLAAGRDQGWGALPSGAFETAAVETGVRIEGVGEGHRVGLCQRGALALAEAGASALQILRVYFPHAAVAADPN